MGTCSLHDAQQHHYTQFFTMNVLGRLVSPFVAEELNQNTNIISMCSMSLLLKSQYRSKAVYRNKDLNSTVEQYGNNWSNYPKSKYL